MYNNYLKKSIAVNIYSRMTISAVIVCLLLLGDMLFAQERKYSLDECIAIGIKNNNDVIIQQQKVEETRYKYYQQYAAYLPQIDATVLYKKYHQLPLTQKELAGVQKIGERPPFDDYLAGIMLNQIVFSGSKLYQIKVFKLAYEYEMKKLDVMRRNIMLHIAKAFYEQVRSNYAVTIQTELHNKLQEQQIITELLYRGGKLTRIDLLKIQTQLAASVDLLENLKNLAYSKALMLGQTLGINEPVYAVLQLNPPNENYFDTSYCKTLPDKHPELEIERLLKEKSNMEKDQAYSLLMPTVYFNANYYREESRFFPENPNWYIGLVATMPLFH